MEASVDLSSPKKAPRRHYKAEFEKMCAYADELVADLGEVKRNRDTHKEMRDYAEQDAAALRTAVTSAISSRDRWATAALIEFIAIVSIAIIQLAR